MQETPLPKTIIKRYLLAALFGTIGGLITIGTIFILDGLIHQIWVSWLGLDPNSSMALAISAGLVIIAVVEQMQAKLKQ